MRDKEYIPNRGDIIWIDFDPSKGKKMGKIRPSIVLSAKAYNVQKGLLICCPITSSMRGGAEEYEISGLDKKSAVVCSIVQTLSWKHRNVSLIKKTDEKTLKNVLIRLLPLIGATEILDIG